MDFLEAYDLIKYALKKNTDEFIEQRWISGYQNMSLTEFREKIGYITEEEEVTPKQDVNEILLDLKDAFS